MSQPEPRRRMRGSDAMFLYFERKEMPLHIGCVAILDGPFDEESLEVLAARFPEIPRYRQRVMFSPLNIAHPSWEYDPEFDVNNHIFRVKLDPPGTERQLSELVGRIFTPLMDRNKPLWDVTVVDGLEGGRSAIICRIHHCMADGVSGIGLASIMFDKTRTPRKVEETEYNPPPLPDTGELLVEGLAGIWAHAAERFLGANIKVLRMAQAFTGDDSKDTMSALLAAIPDLIRPTERLPFNSACSGVRGYCWTSFPFAEVLGIRAALGGTVNDAALTAVAGAFSRYVKAHNEPVTNRYVRLLVPVNLRTEGAKELGVEISMLPLSLPLDIEDPAERMRVVTRRSTAMKTGRIADIVSLIGMSLGSLPVNLQNMFAGFPMMPQPVLIVNTVCTNVPGPMHPLYANGTELLTYYPHVPCGSDVGISIAMSSYNKSLYFGITYDMQAAPDGELFRDFLVESYEELREAAGVPKALSRPMPARPAEIPIPKPEPESASEPELVAEPASEPEQVAEPVDVSVPEIAEPVTVHAAVNGIPKSPHKKKKHREPKAVKDTAGARIR